MDHENEPETHSMQLKKNIKAHVLSYPLFINITITHIHNKSRDLIKSEHEKQKQKQKKV